MVMENGRITPAKEMRQSYSREICESTKPVSDVFVYSAFIWMWDRQMVDGVTAFPRIVISQGILDNI
jgi:hypothetical protein